jgi:putative ABC transport system permease protein
VATLEQRISAVNAAPRSQSFLLGIFAMLGVLLALIGLYGVIAYMVSLQTHEIGVRMAIGATLAQILRLVLMQGIKVTLPGIAIGIAGGIFLTRFMSSLLFGIGALDPLTFACVPFFLAFACLLACWIPARRATKVDPMAALR